MSSKRNRKGKKTMSEHASDRAIFKAVNLGDLQDAHDQAKEKFERATELLRKAWDAYSDSQKAYTQAREQLIGASRTLFSF
jgi:hypothetical protein